MDKKSNKLERQLLVEQCLYRSLFWLQDYGPLSSGALWILLTIYDFVVVIEALKLGCKYGFIESCGDVYQITEDGHFAHEAIVRPESDYKWRKEVTTGTDDSGHETKIEKAALPKNIKKTSNNYADACNDAIDIIDQLKKITGETVESIRDGMADGRIGVCKYGGKSHWGKFHKNGNGYRNICIRCRKNNKDNEH